MHNAAYGNRQFVRCQFGVLENGVWGQCSRTATHRVYGAWLCQGCAAVAEEKYAEKEKLTDAEVMALHWTILGGEE